ncbi:MAG TPA: adenylate/guanylate cyclase domain-containing protein [Chitinophagaceae bacterium]|nr:adenylate/guanylate cyclase domain-containing protein [Chitinophagaceae bacterium]
MQLRRKAYYFLISLLFLTLNVPGQDQKIADSLARIFRLDTAGDQGKLELLRNLAFNESKDLKLAVQYADELITLSLRTNNPLYLHRGYFQKGNKLRMLGNLEEALDNYFKSTEAARNADFVRGEGSAYGAIADVYSVSNNHNNAMLYYNKAIATLRKAGDSIALAAAISNAGDDYLNNKIYDSALLYFKEAEKIFEKVDYLAGKGYSLGNIGMVYANLGNEQLAEKNINEAIRILEESEDYYPICVYLISMADIYEERNDEKAALNYALRSLQLAQQYGLKEQISNANLKLSELYEKAGNNNESFKYYKNHIVYRDSVNDINSVQKLADLRTNYEVSQKQVEVDLLAQKSRNQKLLNLSLFITLGLGLIILGTLYWYYRAIAREKKISESLLLNILPAATAKELKQNGKVDAVKFDSVTVLFTDFVQFTKVAETVEPEQLVKSIDFYFKGFDMITTKYGLEKIKTVGDSYMCASGLPTINETHARNVIEAAREMIELVRSEFKADDELIHFEIRIGVHTGPVVAGIVGIKKWQYDIWGDTVNIASRMESNSKPGKVNLSETTYQLVKDQFACEYRGEIEIKNHGSMKMYFLSV